MLCVGKGVLASKKVAKNIIPRDQGWLKMPWQESALIRKPNFIVLLWESRDYIWGKCGMCLFLKPTAVSLKQGTGKREHYMHQTVLLLYTLWGFILLFHETSPLRINNWGFKAILHVCLNKSTDWKTWACPCTIGSFMFAKDQWSQLKNRLLYIDSMWTSQVKLKVLHYIAM